MDLTKGLPCPCCGETAHFQGGSFGGVVNTTNIVCHDCGFSAWVILTRDDSDYEVSSELKDKGKANPYNKEDKDKLILEKHYIGETLKKTSNRRLIGSLRNALRFIDDILENN